MKNEQGAKNCLEVSRCHCQTSKITQKLKVGQMGGSGSKRATHLPASATRGYDLSLF
ncbi:uncharacterized protein CANTADRAFT_25254 [Suhomyces tanzawaensis NRRL Y-17324]|uniref:Uncharacterized protein n=1 Tax=Suhomyces tanzawaensis NRRL Y-17324 TaxID=984487 RepID=A0A1E4SN48_9ASCO|nr:uncharacterized protein CANTADRAFT_25254 [Suhomyces tanzawaensis NRRL Y-17324]ODV80916.1 hypothetical protein CANTADRAFT_25254 [Suhomyces tanzawaensis NRRL Y-17324]